jgi:plastocyanin
MKKIVLTSFLLFLLASSTKLYTTTHIVQATGMTFIPSQLTATVGDSIKWQWIDGIHNTISTSVPSGAASWNAPLDDTHTTFIYVLTTAGAYNYECSFHVAFGMVGSINANPIGIINQNSEIPHKYQLFQNYPNPFNPSTQIRFDLPVGGYTKVTIYDLIGNELLNLVNENLEAGKFSVTWDASNYPSGLYFYKITSGSYSATKKMMLVK